MRNFFCSEGNLGRTPTLKIVPVQNSCEQKSVLEFDVRFSFDKLNKQTGEYENSGGFWATVEFWGARAEGYNQLLRAGARVLVVGELSQEEYIASKGARAGQKISTNRITAQHIGLVLLGVESIQWSKSKNKNDEATPHTDDEYERYATSDSPIPVESVVPAGE